MIDLQAIFFEELTKKEAIKRYQQNKEILVLHDDLTESIVDSADEYERYLTADYQVRFAKSRNKMDMEGRKYKAISKAYEVIERVAIYLQTAESTDNNLVCSRELQEALRVLNYVEALGY